MLAVTNIVGIHTTDPKLPGTLYLADDGNLTRDPTKAKKVQTSKLQRAFEQIKKMTCQQPFCKEVAEE